MKQRFAACLCLVCGLLALQGVSTSLTSAQLGGIETYQNRKVGADPAVIEATYKDDIEKLRSIWQKQRSKFNERDKLLRTALMIAAWEEQPKAMTFLLEKEVSVQANDLHGNTALHFAALKGNAQIIDALLAHQADVNSQNHNGEVPIFFAIRAEDYDAVKALLEAGADLGVTDYTARNASDYVREVKDRQLQRKLKKLLS